MSTTIKKNETYAALVTNGLYKFQNPFIILVIQDLGASTHLSKCLSARNKTRYPDEAHKKKTDLI